MEALAIGATLASTVVSTAGAAQGAQAEKFAAESRGRVAAIQDAQEQTSALGDLRRQISNIKAIRASAGARLDSPTIETIIAEERDIGDENRRKRHVTRKFEQDQARADSKTASMMKGLAFATGLASGVKTLASY
jgi:hypothetical protein